MRLTDLYSDEDSPSIQAPRKSGGKKTRRAFLASAATATAAVGGLGVAGTAAANDGNTKYVTLTNHFDGVDLADG